MGTIYSTPTEPDSAGFSDADSFLLYDASSAATQEGTFTQLRAYLDTPVNATASTLTLTAETHGHKTVTLNRAAGIAVTLPDATGIGTRFKLIIGTTFTSSATIKVPDASNIMFGHALFAQDAADTAVMFETAVDTDTITFNGTTTGGYKGTVIELIDIAANEWAVEVRGIATGTEATCFSATV